MATMAAGYLADANAHGSPARTLLANKSIFDMNLKDEQLALTIIRRDHPGESLHGCIRCDGETAGRIWFCVVEDNDDRAVMQDGTRARLVTIPCPCGRSSRDYFV